MMLKAKAKTTMLKIIGTIAGVFLFVALASDSISFTQNATAHDVITDEDIAEEAGIVGTDSKNGGNNYISFDDDDIEKISEYLKENDLWNRANESSNEVQLEFYKSLSKALENTSIEPKLGTYTRENARGYITNSLCKRKYKSDYANDECDYNGPKDNKPTLRVASKGESCSNGNVYNIGEMQKEYYHSEDSKHSVGGKILGLYPELLASSTMSQSWTTLDEQCYEGICNKPQGNPFNLFEKLFENIFSWLNSKKRLGTGENALQDIFSEGAMYTTFQFLSEVKCVVTDVARYSFYTGDIPKMYDKDGNLVDYECTRSDSVPTRCKEETYNCDDPNTEEEEGPCTKKVVDEKSLAPTDGYPETYYQHLEGERSCTYIEGSPQYKLSIDWVCLPDPSTPSPVKCTNLIEVKDDRGTILYYKCGNVDENEVRTKIVDPVFDAYEKNTLSMNGYNSRESVNRYIYGFDETKYGEGINPKGYKIDEETRQIVTKHIVLEILGGTEGRSPALADEEGNFYIQSYNRVMNKEQYEDALIESIFIKDRIDENIKEEDKYSVAIFGKFYDEKNVSESTITTMTPEEIIESSNVRKRSMAQNIFYVYEEVSNVIDSGSYNGNGGTSGSGLAQADASGFQPRISAPCYSYPGNNTCVDDNYYRGAYIGECAWYALGRVNEILDNAGSDYDWTYGANGGDWCDISHADDFIKSYDYTTPKKGSIVVWKDLSGSYGHVAIVEAVNGNEVTISETYISMGIYGWNARNTIYPPDGEGPYIKSNAIYNCAYSTDRPGCWRTRKLTIEEMKNWGSPSKYRFECYVYLLKDENSTEDTTEVAKYIVDEFNKDDGATSKINYYNFITYTEGGAQLTLDMITSKYLAEMVEVTGTIENSGYASVDPGLYVGKLNETLNISINNKTYSYKLCEGCKVPRWIGLYKWLEMYKSNRKVVLNLINQAGLSSQFSNNPSKVHTFMRLLYTYGESGGQSKIKELLNAYKTGGDHDVWCTLSNYVYATDNGTTKVFGNYFNMNEMIFDLFTTGNYVRHPNYKLKYYTKDLVNKLLNGNYQKFSTGYLEEAVKNNNVPDTNDYADCINYVK